MPRLLGRDLELTLLARVQPYLWFAGMLLFAVSNHLTGLAGMPRRIYQFEYGGSEIADQWIAGTGISALGGVFLFTSALCFVAVMFGTLLGGRKREQPGIEFAEPLEEPGDKVRILDRWGLWVAVAVVLIIAAYAVPIVQHLSAETFGSRGFSPF